MSNFTPLVEREYEFDGDAIKVTFARLKRKHMMSSLPAMSKLANARMNEGDPVTGEQQEAINDILNNLADILPEYVKEFSGLNDVEGNAISINIVVEDMYFMRLCAMIAMDVVRESSVAMEGKV